MATKTKKKSNTKAPQQNAAELVLADRVAELQKANAELQEARRAALNLMEDALRARRQAEQATVALRASEERFRALFDHVPIGVAVTDTATGRVLLVNDQMQRITGYSREELLRMNSRDFTHPDDQAANAELYRRVLNGEAKECCVEKRYIRKDGQTIWALVTLCTMQDSAEHPVCILGAVEDITERKLREEERERLVSVIQNSHEFIGMFDIQGIPIFVNRAGRSMVGLDHALDIRTTTLPEYFVPEQREFVQQEVLPAIMKEGKWTGELTFQHFKTGARIPVFYDLFRVDDPQTGRPINFATVTRDISEPKRTEEARARLAAVVEYSDDAIVSKDLNGVITSWNQGAARLFGYTAQEAIGRPVTILMPPERVDEEPGILQRIRQGESIDHYETVRRRKDGKLLDVSLTVSPVRDSQGRVIGASKIARDITERKRADLLLTSEKRVLELIAGGAPLLEVLNALVCEVEANSREGMLCSVLLLDDSGQRLRHGAAPSLPEAYNRAIDGIVIGPEVGSCGTAAYRREPVFVSDIANDPLWAKFKDLAAAHGLGACCSTPITSSQGRLLGTLAMYYRHAHDPGENERKLVERASHLAAIAIERRQAEEALRRSQRETQRARDYAESILRTSPVPLLVLDGELRVKSANEAFYKSFEVEPDATKGRLIYELGNGQWNIPRLRELLEEVLPKRTLLTHFEVTHEFETIGPRTMLLNARRMENEPGAAERIVLVIEDITDRKQAERQLQESEERFRMMADNISQLAWTCDELGNVTWYNQRWYDYTGLTFDEMKDWGWRQVHHPDHEQRVVASVTRSRETGEIWEDTFPLRGKDGQYRWFLSRAVPIRDESGNIVRWFGTNTDIEDQRQAEEALRRSEKLAAVGRLAATMAHEVNNPLESVTNLLYLARKDSNLSQQTSQHLLLADQELDRVAHITKQTLGFYRDNASPIALDVTQTVDELLEVYGYRFRNREIAIQKELDPAARLIASGGELRQVFSNLFINAVDATPAGGRIRIRVKAARDWNGSGRRGIRLTIADTGCGIEPAHKAKIFDAFYTTKKDVGTGLGLWLSQSIVRKHHGRIQVRSRAASQNSGTVFCVFWPDESDAGNISLREIA